MRLKFILQDIEGTTTSIDFVHNTLFPYSHRNMADFLAQAAKKPETEALVADAYKVTGIPTGQREELTGALRRWIDEDRKEPVLKAIQGHQWQQGFESGAYKSHLYPDVLPNWQRWQQAGYQLAIYSSGSVQAQRLLFRHTDQGDVSSYLSAYFDTSVGAKQDAQSYLAITAALEVKPEEVMFLSDVPAELQAAHQAGCQGLHVIRPGTQADMAFAAVSDFDGVSKVLGIH